MKIHMFALLTAFALLLTGCGTDSGHDSASRVEWTLWFTTAEGNANSSALGQERRAYTKEEDAGVSELLTALFAGPSDPALRSPFPADTALRSVSVAAGQASVDLSEAYSGLSGVDLTLADACVVLTLCQIPGIERVYLTVEGKPRPFCDQVFSPDDFLLDNTVHDAAPG